MSRTTLAPRATPTSASFTRRDAGLLILLSLLWGNSFLFIKLAVEAIPPVWIVATRMTVGGAVLVAVVAARGLPIPRQPKTLLALLGAGTIGSGLAWSVQAWGQQFLDSGLVSVLNATTPVATLAIAVAVGLESLHRNRVIGMAVAILGTLIVIGGEVQTGGPPLALLAAVGATIGYGAGAVISRAWITDHARPIPAAATQLVLGGIVLNLLAVAVEGTPPAPSSLTGVQAFAVLALGVLGTGTAFVIFFTLVKNVGATNASMVTYLVPIVGLVAGALVRGERFGLNVFVGAAILIGGVYLAQRQPPALTGDKPADPSRPEPVDLTAP